MDRQHKQRLKRLDPESYRGLAWVHWTMTIEGRRTGWLEPRFFYKFREVLAHAMFRYQFACPIFCLMPDHAHLLWCGLSESADQRLAMKTVRNDLNSCLKRIGFEFQRQPYDHVLRESECECSAIEDVAEYIARNPERKGLAPVDGFSDYIYTGCLIPGYPNLRLFELDSWEILWRTLSFLKRTECFRRNDPKYAQKT
ncbi:hypothetical protein [Rhodopirellula bahusiensis]|uniref:Transposase IS200-like domain-containing protein n=1 Tax=Rhodopirellula bahusiensis TaxID=2014065 RepID=A0A2G1W8N8_9BACT|nr:hypothetical protein [Rhodopirellula bahusiensis]PHQ35405.1 hypothetical protein CEE69_10380 [Rhodopirellula bahusiensis]